MEENNLFGMVYPDDLFADIDSGGRVRLYLTDPIEGKPKEIDFADVISSFGSPGGMNVVKIRIKGIFLSRSENFSVSALARMESGEMDAFVMDYEGHVVLVSSDPSGDGQYPLLGEICDRQTGEILGTRRFGFMGQCQDGVESHSLVIVYGRVRW